MNRSMRLVMMFAVAACAGSQASKTDVSSSAASSSAQGGAQSFHATMDAASEVPQPNVGSSTPSCTATFQSDGQTLTYKVEAHGLTSPF
ncbi:MAG TPA: CHRD domain-containing protein, partial [Myxococcales bacterium]|nr:CHRD domain-containing protein [Myxococcales bacterium]